jgi:hypothetical protein
MKKNLHTSIPPYLPTYTYPEIQPSKVARRRVASPQVASSVPPRASVVLRKISLSSRLTQPFHTNFAKLSLARFRPRACRVGGAGVVRSGVLRGHPCPPQNCALVNSDPTMSYQLRQALLAPFRPTGDDGRLRPRASASIRGPALNCALVHSHPTMSYQLRQALLARFGPTVGQRKIAPAGVHHPLRASVARR